MNTHLQINEKAIGRARNVLQGWAWIWAPGIVVPPELAEGALAAAFGHDVCCHVCGAHLASTNGLLPGHTRLLGSPGRHAIERCPGSDQEPSGFQRANEGVDTDPNENGDSCGQRWVFEMVFQPGTTATQVDLFMKEALEALQAIGQKLDLHGQAQMFSADAADYPDLRNVTTLSGGS